jgi:hypothetical protein
LVRKKSAIFSAEDLQKSLKLVIITLTPERFPDFRGGEFQPKKYQPEKS